MARFVVVVHHRKMTDFGRSTVALDAIASGEQVEPFSKVLVSAAWSELEVAFRKGCIGIAVKAPNQFMPVGKTLTHHFLSMSLTAYPVANTPAKGSFRPVGQNRVQRR